MEAYPPTSDLRSPSIPFLRTRNHFHRYTSTRHISAPRASYAYILSTPTAHQTAYRPLSYRAPSSTPGEAKRALRFEALKVNTHRRCVKGCGICYPDLTKVLRRGRREAVVVDDGEEGSEEDEMKRMRKGWMESYEAEAEARFARGEESEMEVPEADWGVLLDRALMKKGAKGPRLVEVGSGYGDGDELEMGSEWEVLSESEEEDWEVV